MLDGPLSLDTATTSRYNREAMEFAITALNRADDSYP